jgi:hypothetical protein
VKKQETFAFPNMSPDERLLELSLYVAKKCQFDPKYGATKLNKILFYSDFMAYGQTGKSITGSEYMRLPNGPAPRRLKPIRAQMERKKDAVVQTVTLPNGRRQDRLIALREPNIDIFSAAEISLVDDVIEFLRNDTAKEVSDRSHNRIWRIAADQESIPYEAVFISDSNADEADALKLRELAKEHEWAR